MQCDGEAYKSSLQSTTPPKPAKIYKMSDIGIATGCVIGIGASIIYLVAAPIIDYLTHKTS
jgi:hypothetical protein